jgi:hypothetical protein
VAVECSSSVLVGVVEALQAADRLRIVNTLSCIFASLHLYSISNIVHSSPEHGIPQRKGVRLFIQEENAHTGKKKGEREGKPKEGEKGNVLCISRVLRVRLDIVQCNAVGV